MNKKIILFVIISAFILCAFSSCSKPNNSENGDPLVPGAVTTIL